MSTTIEKLKALEAAATKTPWHLDAASGNIVQTKHVTRDVWTIPHTDMDMPFIVAARNALPALLRVAEAAKRAVDELGRIERNGGPTESTAEIRLELHEALAALEAQ